MTPAKLAAGLTTYLAAVAALHGDHHLAGVTILLGLAIVITIAAHHR